MEYIIHEIIDILTSVLLLTFLFRSLLTSQRLRYLLCMLLVALLLGITYAFIGKSNLPPVDFLINISISFILLRASWVQKTVSFFLCYVLNTILIQVISMAWHLLVHGSLLWFTTIQQEKIFIQMIANILLLFLLIIQSKKKFYIQLTLRAQFILSGFCVVFSTLLILFSQERNRLPSSFSNMIAIFFMAALLCVLAFLITDIRKNTAIEKEQEQTQYIKILRAYYQQVKKNETESRKLRHDMNNHLNILKQLILAGKFDDAKNYLDQFDHAVQKHSSAVPELGNALVNAVIAQKINQYPAIHLICKGALSGRPLTNEYDICTILVNLLDNALEFSCRSHYDCIFFYLFEDESMMEFRIMNYIPDSFSLQELKTSSKSRKGHGYGVRNIRDAVLRLHGHLDYSVKDGLLIAKVQLTNGMLSV